MCGRLTLKTAPEQWGQILLPLVDELNLPEEFAPRYNIAPTQSIYAIAQTASGSLGLRQFRWGLVPSWAGDLTIGSSMINARRETLPEKRSFKSPLEKRRCLVIADGYYEWLRISPKEKHAYWITPTQGNLLCLAGLWEINNKATGQPVATCTIITTGANQTMSKIHDRMPIALVGSFAQQWIDPQTSAAAAYELLGPMEDDFLKPLAVSSYVNNARHDDAKCIQPLSP